MWQSASPDPVRLLRFDSVGETLGQERAIVTQRFSCSDRVFAGRFVREVLGKENFGDVPTGHTTSILNEVVKFAVGLSPVAHKVKVSGGF